MTSAKIGDLPRCEIVRKDITRPSFLQRGSWRLTVKWGPVAGQRMEATRERVFFPLYDALVGPVQVPVTFAGRGGKAYVQAVSQEASMNGYAIIADVVGIAPLRKVR